MALKQVEFRQGVRENAHWALNSKVVMMKRQSGKHLRATGLRSACRTYSAFTTQQDKGPVSRLYKGLTICAD